MLHMKLLINILFKWKLKEIVAIKQIFGIYQIGDYDHKYLWYRFAS